jgi:hypothetical protein
MSETFESLVDHLEECAEDDIYFEIDGEDAKILLQGIRDLQRNVDRASRYQYPDTTGR